MKKKHQEKITGEILLLQIYQQTKFIKFLSERLLNHKTKEKYKEFTGYLFGHGVLTYNDSNEIEKAKEKIIKEQEEKAKQKPKKIVKKIEKEEDDYEL